MAKGWIVTQYDDAGYASAPNSTLAITLATSYAGGVVKASPGRLLRVFVTTALVGSGGTLVFYDNASAGTGLVLLTIPTAGGTAGASFIADLPAVNGIYALNTSATLSAGAVVVGFS